jgi:Leucine-rich repeat (LRR) protein
MKTLSQVYLEKNSIERIESLEAFKQLKDLERLELRDNPVTAQADYRKRVLEM